MMKCDQSLCGQPLQHIGRDASDIQIRNWHSARRAAQQFNGVLLAALRGDVLVVALRGEYCSADRLVRLGRRHGRGKSIAGAARVILCDPQCKIHHVAGQERLIIEYFEDAFDFVGRRLPRFEAASWINDDAGDTSVAERHHDARPSRREGDAVGHPIRQNVEKRNGNRDRNQPHRIRPRLRR